MKVLLSPRQRFRGHLLILAISLAFFFWQLGSTGLIDETPPLFAAAARAMSNTGDWLTPRVNGLTRFDKPPLVYWLMAFVYGLPGQSIWDPLGTWAARFPSAISSVILMFLLGDTMMRWPQKADCFPRRTALITSLSFALSPLIMVWSRIAVSDALLCCTLGATLLLAWRHYINPTSKSWFISWIVLGLAVLTKGPVAIILMGMTLLIFSIFQKDFWGLWIKLKPLKGIIITGFVSLPWYLIELFIEGRPFWNSFFGYHNFQRFTSVVNFHQEPWWFFGLILVIASLPFTPLLLLGIKNSFFRQDLVSNKPEESLLTFSSSWLISVLLLFTCSATKLPSYWIPAIPAASMLVGITSVESVYKGKDEGFYFAWLFSSFLSLVLGIVLWLSPLWLLYVEDPEIPDFGLSLISTGLVFRAAFFLTIAGVFGLLFNLKRISKPLKVITLQLPLAFFQLFFLIPMFGLVDDLRQQPIRQAADLILKSQKTLEPLAMVGVQKPSLHFYTNNVVLYVGRSEYALVNLYDRLRNENRDGWSGLPIEGASGSKTTLVVIDNNTLRRRHWMGLQPEELGRFGIYRIWRIDRRKLENRATKLINEGINPNWENNRPERL